MINGGVTEPFQVPASKAGYGGSNPPPASNSALAQEQTTREKFNHLKRYYDETWDPKERTLHVGLFKKKSASLAQSYADATAYLIKGLQQIRPLRTDSVVLDIGCGTGRTLITVCEKCGCAGVGVDLSDAQIQDAKEHLASLNTERRAKKLPELRIRYMQGSGSDLRSVLGDEQFTHAISQDALFLVSNKQALFEGIARHLVPGGAVGIADFLSASSKKDLTKTQKDLIYKFVNWNESLSFEQYQAILSAVGMEDIQAEARPKDMIQTYTLLADALAPLVDGSDATYRELRDRYRNIASAVKEKKMNWGFFFAQKPPKRILLAGIKPRSLARFFGKALHAQGWDVWLYSRSAKRMEQARWHERKCDIRSPKDIRKLLAELPSLDGAVQLADTNGRGALEDIVPEDVSTFLDAKLLGSVLLTQQILRRFASPERKVQLVWCAGKTSQKPLNLMLYSITNSGLASFIDELNVHYKDRVEAFYIPTPLLSPSTLGDVYIKKYGKHLKDVAKHPDTVLQKLLLILEGKATPGMQSMDENTL